MLQPVACFGCLENKRRGHDPRNLAKFHEIKNEFSAYFVWLRGSGRGIRVRIIAGKYRGRNLKSPPSIEVRPTSDRLRETLFNVLATRLPEAKFLDLCAGSGAVGIEALSRGATHVTFVDRSRKMCNLIEANLDLCRIPEEETEVLQAEVMEFLRHSITRGNGPWNIAFFDPPYTSDYLPALQLFGEYAGALLGTDALLIAEHHHKKSLPDKAGRLLRQRILKQGDSALSFYKHSK